MKIYENEEKKCYLLLYPFAHELDDDPHQEQGVAGLQAINILGVTHHLSINQFIKQSIINQSINQSINHQSINHQSINQ